MAQLLLLVISLCCIILQSVGQVNHLCTTFIVLQLSQLRLKVTGSSSPIIDYFFEVVFLLSSLFGEMSLGVFEGLGLLFNDFDLRVQYKLLTFHFERLLIQINNLLIVITSHLRILSLQQTNMLVTGLIIVIETANT